MKTQKKVRYAVMNAGNRYVTAKEEETTDPKKAKTYARKTAADRYVAALNAFAGYGHFRVVEMDP